MTSGMLRALPADERAAMLAHERAHIRHRHHYYAVAARAAIAINPLMRGIGQHIAFQLERWADEDAATAVNNRPLAARSLARAALAIAAATRPAPPAGALAYLRNRVTTRVLALQADRPTSRWGAAWPAAAAVILTGLLFADATTALARCLEVLHR